MLLSAITPLSPTALAGEVASPSKLVLNRDASRRAELVEFYAPFDHVNRDASVAIIGLTPGRQQALLALEEARAALLAGASEAEALARAKRHASFGGPMRRNLVDLLDGIGVARRLGIASTAALWEPGSPLAHFTSALRYPVLRAGENYSGTPDPLGVPMLRQRIETTLAAELAALPDTCLIVPLGPVATRATAHAAGLAGLEANRILSGLPHPSGANAERIAVFLGRKPAAQASAKTDPARLLAARAALTAQMEIA